MYFQSVTWAVKYFPWKSHTARGFHISCRLISSEDQITLFKYCVVYIVLKFYINHATQRKNSTRYNNSSSWDVISLIKLLCFFVAVDSLR